VTDNYRVILSPAWFGRTRVTIEYLTGADASGVAVGPQRICRFTESSPERAEREAALMVGAIQNRNAPGVPFRMETRT
jgi:hypothetical protein